MGNFFNDIMGVTSANKQQARANMALQNDAQAYSTWQMQNAHQLETQDLINAGINPVLSANGGASAGVSAGSTGAGGGGAGDPISMIATLVNTANNSAKTDADIKNSTKKTIAEVKKLNAETKNINQNTNNGGTGGTSFTRTFDWSAKKYKKAQEKINTKLNEIQKKGKSLSWADFKQKLKSK